MIEERICEGNEQTGGRGVGELTRQAKALLIESAKT